MSTNNAPKPDLPAPIAKPRFMKQANMVRVLYALAPVLLAGIYFFGWRALALLAVCVAGGLLTEAVTAARRGTAISTACFVTCALYALSLPPTTPFWIAGVGVVVAILFGKEVFGGFGRNFANPALVGRAFVYVCFPVELTARFVPVFRGLPGGFARWSFETMREVPSWLSRAAVKLSECVTTATPMWARRDFGFAAPLKDLFLGTIGGTFQSEYGPRVLAAGSIGEVSALLILLAGLYLLLTRTANWRLTVSTLAGVVAANLLLRNLGGFDAVPPLAFTLCSGALLYGAVFMVTDPVSAPKRPPSMVIYGLLVGVLVVVLRWRAQFSGAVAFSILIANLVAPTLDMIFTPRPKTKKAG